MLDRNDSDRDTRLEDRDIKTSQARERDTETTGDSKGTPKQGESIEGVLAQALRSLVSSLNREAMFLKCHCSELRKVPGFWVRNLYTGRSRKSPTSVEPTEGPRSQLTVFVCTTFQHRQLVRQYE